MHAHHHSEGRVHAFQLLAQDAQAHVVHARAAPSLPDGCAQEPELTHPVEDLSMHLSLLIPLADVWRDLRCDELADRVLDEQVLRGQ